MVYIKQPDTSHGISRSFGNGHNGIDYMFPMNTPVYAAADGVVDFEGDGRFDPWTTWMGGIYIRLKHSDMYTGYAHLNRTVVDKGQRVTKGQLIGYSGSTGASTGPHLHFEVIDIPQNWNNGYSARINPVPFFLNNASADEVRQAYLEILERPADDDGIRHYTQYTLDFVRADLRSSDDYRRLQANKIAAAQEKARLAEQERLAAEAAVKAEAERQAAAAVAAQKAAEAAAAQKAADDAAAAIKAAQEAEKASYTQADRDRDNATHELVKKLWQFITELVAKFRQ